MWTQMMTMTSAPEREADLLRGFAALADVEQPNSGLVRTTVLRSDADPSRVVVLVTFESEEKARVREQDPRRQEGLARVREAMAASLDGPPTFEGFSVVLDR